MEDMCSTTLLKNQLDNMQKELATEKKERDVFRKENIEEHKELWKWIFDIKDIIQWFVLDLKTNYITSENAEKKFASKLTEKLVYSTAWMMLTAVIGGLIYMVVNK